MQGTKQICDFALHKFLEKIEQAILEGFRVHKTPTSYAKLIGGRYSTVMVKPKDVENPDGGTLGVFVKGVDDVPHVSGDTVDLSGLGHPLKQGGGVVGSLLSNPEALTIDELPQHTNVLPSKPTARKTTKKAGDESES